jgi:hypothetical protein
MAGGEFAFCSHQFVSTLGAKRFRTFLIRGKFTACAYLVNNFPDIFFGNCWGYEAAQLKVETTQKNSDCQLNLGTSRARV